MEMVVAWLKRNLEKGSKGGLDLKIFALEASFCKRPEVAGTGWVDGKPGLAMWVNNLGGAWGQIFLAGGALLTVFISSTSSGFCAFERVEPHHEGSGSLFLGCGRHGERDQGPSIKSSLGNFSFKHSKARDVHAESLGDAPPWLWERSWEDPKAKEACRHETTQKMLDSDYATNFN